MQDLFTVLCIESIKDATDAGPHEVQHVHDFETCGAALAHAIVHARRNPDASIELWINRQTLLWQRTCWHQSPEREDWTHPQAVGTYHATYDQALEPTYYLVSLSHANS